MNSPDSLSRRQFIVSNLAVGSWLLGVTTLPVSSDVVAQGAVSPKLNSPFDFYLKFDKEGMVTAYTTVTNLGQGTHVLVAQIVMEELGLAMHQVKVEHAPVIKAYHQQFPQGITTFASVGFRQARLTTAPAAAAAREMLIAAAAQIWQVSPAECTVENASVQHQASQRSLPYVQLLDLAATQAVPQKPKVKPPKEWTVLGKSLPRPDIDARVDGSVKFGIDISLPGMLYAAVIHAPRFGETLIAVDVKPAMKIKGVRKVVRLPNAVAVIATSYWIAQKASQQLKPEWKAAPQDRLSSPVMLQKLRDAIRAGDGMAAPGQPTTVAAVDQALMQANQVIDTEFEAPFLAHAPMEPLNATVEVSQRGAQVWLSTQSQTDTQRGVAQALGMQTEQVTIHTQNVGGGFGRRLEQDFAVEAALIAREVNVPVKTIWSRENDMRSGYYRPITSARIRLALDAQGLPSAMCTDLASPSLLAYTKVTNSPLDEGFDWTTIMGIHGNSYALPLHHARWSKVDFGVPCAYWRSVGYSQNVHFIEHTLELAACLNKQDSIEFRRRILQNNPKALAFMNAFAERAQWDSPMPATHFRGFAMNGYGKRLFSAHIVEIAVTEPGKYRLVKIFAAIDPGVAGNPAAIEHQMQGGTLFGLSAALFGEITFKDGLVEQGNFDSYRLMTMAQTPPLEVFILANGEVPQGVGEEGPPSVIAALANALLKAGGKPVNKLPLRHSGWELLDA